MKLQNLTLAPLATAGLFLGYLAHLQAGEVAPMPMLEPTSDCDACNTPGVYGGVSLLYLKPYGDDGSNGSGGEWDPGVRATLGYERPDGLFFELNGMWFDGSYDTGSDGDGSEGSYGNYSQDQSTWYIEGVVGDNLHCGELCVDYAFGVRYGQLENKYGRDYYWSVSDVDRQREEYTFEGVGPVFRLDATRELNQQVSLYGGFSEAILFGDLDYNSRSRFGPSAGTIGPKRFGDDSREEIAFVTELEFGIQYNLNMAALEGFNIRLGVEGQFWSIDGEDYGFFGGVLGAGFNF